MYCSSCGRTVTPSLSYCNHCGARLDGAKGDGAGKSSGLRPETLVAGIASVFIFGLGAIIGLLAALKFVFSSRDDLGLIIAFTMLSFLILIVVEGVFISMLLRRTRSAREVGDTGRLTDLATKEKTGDSNARLLPEPPLSITEHTTRSFEPVSSKPATE